MSDRIPLQSKIKSIRLFNFDGSRDIDISPQIHYVEMFESLFEPLQKAVITIYDPIGLFHNFPLIGEEYILIEVSTREETIAHAFCIEAVRKITPSQKNREVSYELHLVSVAALADAVVNVQHAFNGSISKVVSLLYKRYVEDTLEQMANKSYGLKKVLAGSIGTIQNDRGTAGMAGTWLDSKIGQVGSSLVEQSRSLQLNPANIEESLGDDAGTIIIPNLKPFSAFNFLAQRSTPQEYSKSYNYLFWQTRDGFHFETLQKKMRQSSKQEYIYLADVEIANKMNIAHLNNLITNIVFNNRITTLEKVADGYFENTLFEINMLQNKYVAKNSTLKDDYKQTVASFAARDDRHDTTATTKTNTSKYLDMITYDSEKYTSQGNLESKNRVRYTMNNRTETDAANPLMNRDLVWGNSTRAMTALNQIDLHITVPGNTRISAGDIITVKIPKFEGFNDGDGNTSDKLVAGRFIVSDVKNLYHTVGSVHSTVLRINKDVYQTDPDDLKFLYNLGALNK